MPVRVEKTRQTRDTAIALCNGRRYIPDIAAIRIRDTMRAEIERLVEEIEQSVGLLRRHL
jgi:uncharacterized protein YlzI (FlbEa/FlbD family)